MQRRASAQWRGGLKDGKGTVSTASGALKTVAYGFAMRFENEPGTNPEELVAAAHASCFAMAFSSELGKAGYRPDLIEVKATLDFDKADAGWSVKSIHLDATAKVPGADPAKFQTAAETAKKTCPISRLLNTQITKSNTRPLAPGLKAKTPPSIASPWARNLRIRGRTARTGTRRVAATRRATAASSRTMCCGGRPCLPSGS